jgi:hypothetical protein
MPIDKRIEIVVAVSLPIVIFVGACALCFFLMIIFAQGTSPTTFEMIAFFGAVAPSLILSITAVFPWLSHVPKRWALPVAGLIPTVVLCVLTPRYVGAGHNTKVLVALSPMVAAVILPMLPFFSCLRHKAIPRRKRVVGISFSIVLLIAVLWSAFWLWGLTNSNFMGASC